MLRDIHVRVSDEQYEMLTALSKALKLSQAEIIRASLFTSDMKTIIKDYRKRKEIDDFTKYACMEMNEKSRQTVNTFVNAFNKNTSQLRMIGANISALVRDIRVGKVQPDIYTSNMLSRMEKKYNDCLDSHIVLADECAKLMLPIQMEVTTRL